MSKVIVDERFSCFSTDPKFRSMPRKKKKVKIDSRFHSMFKDPNFTTKVNVDKRGRPANYASKDNYSKYYSLDTSYSNESLQDTQIKMDFCSIDRARGQGAPLLDSSSSDEDDDFSEEVNMDYVFDKWGELDHDADRGKSVEITSRLAVCNMDWDRVGASDIFLALNSFCGTSGGHILRVDVFLSDYGRDRLKDEDLLGPAELRNNENCDDFDCETSEKLMIERLRVYQINRLRYYYAIVCFDSLATANRVYEQCDGTEYELSASCFDLRFVPNESVFNDTPIDVCDVMPDSSSYKPKVFCTSALQLGKVDLTWDEVDKKRQDALKRSFTDIDNIDNVTGLLAMSSEDESVEDEENSSDVESKDQSIKTYLSLIASLKDDQQQEKYDQGNMEITWEEKVDAPNSTDAKLTPWEKYLHKKQEKRKRRRKEADMKKSRALVPDESDLPADIDVNDPYFREELIKSSPSKEISSHSNGDDLALLVMKEEKEAGHFNYDEIVARESKKGKKSRRRQKNINDTEADTFKVNVHDERFGAIYDEPLYNIDPSHPNFKKTHASMDIVEEKQKRILSKTSEEEQNSNDRSSNKNNSDLESLVARVKTKSKRHKTELKFKKISL